MKTADFDLRRFTEWMDGNDKVIEGVKGQPPTRLPQYGVWTQDHVAPRGLRFGLSKNPGPRYLRVGLLKDLHLGAILVTGNVQVSVLKQDAQYPGVLNDDAQWLPGTRLQDGKVTSDETGKGNEAAMWVFPPGTKTTALRFSHVAKANDENYLGIVTSAYVLPGRFSNLAPQAIVATSSSPEKANKINDNIESRGDTWDNIHSRTGDRAQKVSSEDPEWIMMVWPRPVTLRGLGFLIPGFGTAEVQIYTGPESTHPRDAAERDWQKLTNVSVELNAALSALDSGLGWLDFGKEVTTRAVRVLITKPIPEQNLGWHWTGDGNGEKRVWLSELLALQDLGESSLKPAVADAALDYPHPPIPIHFTLPEDGLVTLVIEDSTGKRVRNLVAQASFQKGDNVAWWDGTDDLGRDVPAANHGLYLIPPAFVPPGSYVVRGLWHKPLDLRYEFSVYNPGDPPWPTVDNTGGWMTSHTPASCAVFIPAEKAPGHKPLVGIGAYVSEGGSAFSWLDLDGKKIGGRGWIGGAWTGAQFLAADTGPHAEPKVAAYVGSTFEGNIKYGVDGKVEIRLTKLTTLIPNGDQPVLKEQLLLDPLPDLPPGPNGKKVRRSMDDYLGGVAVHDGLLVFSQPAYNKIVFVDAKDGYLVGDVAVQDPRALAFDDKGRLLVLSGQTLLRYPENVKPPNVPVPEKFITGFEEPRGITVDSLGKIYVADQGKSHQVKLFTDTGRYLGAYGKPGAPQAGPYDPLHMNHPKGITVDSNGRLWVTEDDFQPKRVSVWNPDGSLYKAWYGGPQYGGGGILDPKQIGAFLYNGMEFQLDWQKGSYELSRIYFRTGADNLDLAFRAGVPEDPVYFNGKRYLTDVFNSNGTTGQGNVYIFLDKGDHGAVVPVAGAGRAYDWPILQTDEFKSLWPAEFDLSKPRTLKENAFFIWSDLNGDGQVQPNEVKIIPGGSGGITVADDGSFMISHLGTDADSQKAVRFKPVSFTAQGAPVYDINAGEALTYAQSAASDGGDQILQGTDGWLVMATAPRPYSNLGLGGAKNGVPAWSYPSLWPGLHPSHNSAIPTEPGMLVGTTHLLGGLVTPRGSEAGPLFFINSNQGDIYAFTQDGLFVARLFEDFRQAPYWEMQTAIRNMPVNGLSIGSEDFFPTVAQTSAGQVYINCGANMAIVRVDNLDTIRKIAPFPLTVTAEDLKNAQAYVRAREAVRQAAQGSGVLAVPILASAPSGNVNLEDWSHAQWAPIDHRGTAAWFDSKAKPYAVDGALSVAGGKLYAIWKTDDPKLLLNAGDIPNALFKSGGALDLMIGTDPTANPNRPAAVAGDERLLISTVDGKTRALLYRAVVPGTPLQAKVPFNAPWHGITLDRVDDVSDQVEFSEDHNGNYEISVPLSVLGLTPLPRMRIKGDIGILRGDGKQTTQRIYWANKATAMVADVPTEAELTPSLWGTFEFHAQ
ncbi:MAG: hypothetical protein WCD79_16545 [Chthoniobacteraceae bacterium]